MLFTTATRLSLLAAITATFAAFSAGAQTREFRSLPTDDLPPFGMLDDQGVLVPLPDPATLHGGPAPEPPAPVAGPSLDVAIAGAQAALAACEAIGAPVAAAVVDVKGRPRALLMSPETEGSVFVAMRKAAATLAFDAPSIAIPELLENHPELNDRLTPAMFLAGGALPIRQRDRSLGAIAVSGARGDGPIGSVDEVCAQAGLQAILSRLPD